MRVLLQVLAPGVQHEQPADPRAQVLGVGGDRLQGLGRRVKQQPIQQLGVEQGQRRQFVREREDEMEVGDGQQLAAAVRIPLRLLAPLALRTVPVATGVVGDLLPAARVALLHVPAQGSRATRGQVGQGFRLARRELAATPDAVVVGVRPDDVAEGELPSTGRSQGLTTLCSRSSVTCV